MSVCVGKRGWRGNEGKVWRRVLGPPVSGYASLAAYIVCLARRACGGAIHLIVELVERLPVLAERPRAVAYIGG